jgi:membrane protein EpsK
MFGTEAGGRYAAVLQWSMLLRTIAMTVAAIFGPTILYFYARNDIEGMVQYSRRAVKFIGLVVALPAGLISGFAPSLLRIWLGESFVDLAPLMVLMTLPLAINLAYLPLHNISTALARVRVPGIVQLFSGALNLGLAIALCHVPGWGLYGVATAGIVVLILRSVTFTPIYASYLLNVSRFTFYREALPIGLASGLVVAACWGAQSFIPVSGWLGLLLAFSAASAFYASLVYAFFLTPDDRQMLLAMISRLLRRYQR